MAGGVSLRAVWRGGGVARANQSITERLPVVGLLILLLLIGQFTRFGGPPSSW